MLACRLLSSPNTAVNPCTSSNCSYMCLLGATSPGYTCICPEGQELLEDQSTCEGLLVANEFIIYHYVPAGIVLSF